MTEERLEALAEYYSHPEAERLERWGDPNALGKLLGISAATVRKAKLDKRTRAQVKEILEIQMLYLVVEGRAVLERIIKSEKEKADARIKAIRTAEQLAGNLTANGPVVNVTNDFSTYENLTTEELIALGKKEFGSDN